MGLDEIQKVGEEGSLRALELSLVAVKDLDAGDLCRHGRIADYLQLQDGQRDLEVWCESGFVPISVGEEVVLGSAM